MDQPPPPPYSETDIYSNAPTSPINLTPATSQADNRSLPTPSAASSVDESVVFTPPYTPTGSVNQSFGDHDHVSSTSATAYFESRPTHALLSTSPTVHSIAITPMTEPKDLPYPEPVEDFMSKDITQQDWATFINYLIPDHATGVNNDVADRKLKAEIIDEHMRRLTLGQEDRSRTNLSQVDAQLDPLRQVHSPQSLDRMRRLEETISEWNEGFFMPRGVKIRLIDSEREPDDGTLRMPGAWIPNEQDPLEGPNPNDRGSRRGWGFGGVRADSRGFKLGPIVADNDGFRIGNTLVADHNGFKMGNMVADHNGFRFGGFVANNNGVSMGGRSFGRRESHNQEKHCGRGRERGMHGHHHGRGRSHSHGRHGRRRGRSSSTSSSSSSSSSGSSDSDMSVGSLPEYDDLKDQQLPIAKQSLLDWLNNPDQPITKETIQNIKREIKVAKKTTPPKQFDQDMKDLRKEVKGLMKQFRDKKKAQKILRRELKRERRAAKKEQRKERRAAKKEARETRKSERRGKHRENERRFPPGMPGIGPMPHGGMPHRGMPHGGMPFGPGSRGFPFGRGGGPVPFGRGSFSRTHSGPPGMSAMHGGWPFTQVHPYAPGGISVPDLGGFPEPIAHGASSIHEQAVQMDQAASRNEAAAIDLRTAATGRQVNEKERLKMKDEATALEEEAEKFRFEADRLRAEAMHLDSELAKEFDEENGGQATGVISHSATH